mmetsp:Transcript_39869/g.94700  ORF Transcript_39869/g.94700 Transcript_39869/m.94700 type:complete len:233 (+) Transcript_39869:917-1615(+)
MRAAPQSAPSACGCIALRRRTPQTLCRRQCKGPVPRHGRSLTGCGGLSSAGRRPLRSCREASGGLQGLLASSRAQALDPQKKPTALPTERLSTAATAPRTERSSTVQRMIRGCSNQSRRPTEARTEPRRRSPKPHSFRDPLRAQQHRFGVDLFPSRRHPRRTLASTGISCGARRFTWGLPSATKLRTLGTWPWWPARWPLSGTGTTAIRLDPVPRGGPSSCRPDGSSRSGWH